MSTVDLVMPKMGESIMEATILRWHKKPGDSVKMDETLLEIATDKVDTEVPSTAEGVIAEILFSEQAVVPIGAVIARISVNGSFVANTNFTPISTIKASNSEIYPVKEEELSLPEPIDIPYQPSVATIQKPASGSRFYSPLVMNIASSEGISLSELETIPGTGNEGRVTKKDLLEYIAKRGGSSTPKSFSTPSAAAQQAVVQPPVQPDPIHRPTLVHGSDIEVVEMDRMRRLIADHMIRSKATSAHVTSFVEVDVTHLVMWRERVKKDFEKREGEKITFTPLFIEAIVNCIKRFPILNSSVDGYSILMKKNINIGMATALPSGNLIVPVIKEADHLNLVGLTRQVNALARAAREGRLKPDDTQGGTFTFTNVGTFGSLMGTPIINQPQVAILATGAIKKRPIVMETEEGDSIAIRHMMYMSMTYDHRIIDGAIGSSFLTAVAKELEAFPLDRNY